jgi:hypothetical protein
MTLFFSIFFVYAVSLDLLYLVIPFDSGEKIFAGVNSLVCVVTESKTRKNAEISISLYEYHPKMFRAG